MLALTPVAPTMSLQLHLQYTNIRSGGHSGAALLRTGLWMPYVLLPGIQAPNMGSIVITGLRFQTLHLPGQSDTGINDISLVDLAVHNFGWGGVALGPGLIFPAATSPLLGRGKLQIGPAGAVGSGRLRPFVLTLGFFNAFSVAGAPDRPNVSTLFLTPVIGYLLPKAFYLRFDPLWTFDWIRGGHATLPVNLAVGHAFNPSATAEVQPEWVTTGDLQNSFTVRLILNYMGW